jgi:hypothetical protein
MTGTSRAKATGGSGAVSTTTDEAAGEYGSQIITALEQAWAAIRDQHPEIPDVVAVTGAGSNQKGLPKGYALRGHHWPERWVTDPAEHRMPELFVAGELLAAGGRAILEVMLHEAAHALAVVRGIKDTSAEGNRYHNKRFVALAIELGLRGPDRPEKVLGWSNCQITDETAAAYVDVIGAIDTARLPHLPGGPLVTGGGGEDGQGGGEDDQGGQDKDKPTKRGGRREAVKCACQPPRTLHMTPKQIEDGPVICGVCNAPFQAPDASDEGEAEED